MSKKKMKIDLGFGEREFSIDSVKERVAEVMNWNYWDYETVKRDIQKRIDWLRQNRYKNDSEIVIKATREKQDSGQYVENLTIKQKYEV